MKTIIILGLILGMFQRGRSQEVPTDNTRVIVPFARFYRNEYRKFLDSPEINELIKKSIPNEKMSDSERMFYNAGFIAGLIELNTFDVFKKNPGGGFVDRFGEGKNAGFQRRGLQAGFLAGRKIGDKILAAYSNYLKHEEDSGGNGARHIVEDESPNGQEDESGPRE